jgi:hypothetical protein
VEQTGYEMKRFIIQAKEYLLQACNIGHQMKTFIIQEWEPRDCLCHLKLFSPDQVRKHSLKWLINSRQEFLNLPVWQSFGL